MFSLHPFDLFGVNTIHFCMVQIDDCWTWAGCYVKKTWNLLRCAKNINLQLNLKSLETVHKTSPSDSISFSIQTHLNDLKFIGEISPILPFSSIFLLVKSSTCMSRNLLRSQPFPSKAYLQFDRRLLQRASQGFFKPRVMIRSVMAHVWGLKKRWIPIVTKTSGCKMMKNQRFGGHSSFK